MRLLLVLRLRELLMCLLLFLIQLAILRLRRLVLLLVLGAILARTFDWRSGHCGLAGESRRR